MKERICCLSELALGKVVSRTSKTTRMLKPHKKIENKHDLIKGRSGEQGGIGPLGSRL
jgi:hypothetical protein